MGPNGPYPNGDSDALFAAEVHSFLRGKLSADRPAFAVKILPGAARASLDSRVRILYGQPRSPVSGVLFPRGGESPTFPRVTVADPVSGR
jgi:hypothetical protein